MDQIFIQHRYSISQDGLFFQDALTLPKSEYELLTPEQIEGEKQSRFQAWKTIVTTPPPALTKEQQLALLAAEKKSLQDQLADVVKREDELNIKGGK